MALASTDPVGQTEETRLLRLGGAAGALGSALLLGTFVFVAALGLPDPSTTESLLRFPEIKTARVVENTLYLAALVLMALHTLALSRTLRRTSPAASFFGGAVGVLGFTVLICGALLHVATAPLADLHRDAPPEDKTTVVLVWQGVQSIFDTLLVTGAALVPFALIALGRAMLDSPAFGPAVGRTGLVLGVISLTGAAVAVVIPGSLAVAASILGLSAFHAVVGLKSYRRPSQPGSPAA
ncbi:hypothetical protein ABGB12_02010 [Actinocorallia sp. B10E7]|uniref:hypothetical protein n=1 Tax=Actinocorallia sp. B10E7 TaxID=3153558 RepID=UPI00325E7725